MFRGLSWKQWGRYSIADDNTHAPAGCVCVCDVTLWDSMGNTNADAHNVFCYFLFALLPFSDPRGFFTQEVCEGL